MVKSAVVLVSFESTPVCGLLHTNVSYGLAPVMVAVNAEVPPVPQYCGGKAESVGVGKPASTK